MLGLVRLNRRALMALTVGSNQRFLYHRDTSAGSMEIGMPCVLQVLDSPSSTSEITYHLYMRAYVGSTINASGYDRSIIAMEIA